MLCQCIGMTCTGNNNPYPAGGGRDAMTNCLRACAMLTPGTETGSVGCANAACEAAKTLMGAEKEHMCTEHLPAGECPH
jgi:hypothetical protein